MGSIKLIVGLGNPGLQYSRNRHNIGFQVVDLLGRRSAIALDKMQHKAMTGTGWLEKGGQRSKVILARPLTFMNNSGDAVAPLARFFQIEPPDILVVADDLDLASGKLRMRKEGKMASSRSWRSWAAPTSCASRSALVARPGAWTRPTMCCRISAPTKR
jgi:PTH1 family peptidyl-tRNA hydrolase